MAMPHADAPIVATTAGRVRGLWREGSAAFLGIPFAQPPVGPLRFAAPVPPAPWDGVRDATAHGATPQRGDTGITLIPEPSVPGEATLNVDVFTPRPADAAAALPVLVYIHGGGFVSGSPASPWYDGAAFARDGVVTVTVSYRLGFDGFGYIEQAPHNRGVRDWLAALEWVQREIRAFGGDPGRVTLAGQSASGGAVLTLLGMPAAQHLFHAAWAISAATGDVPVAAARERAARLAALAGVSADRAGFSTVDELVLRDLQQRAEHAPSRDRLAPARAMLAEGIGWGPMVDGELVPRPVLDALAAGVGADKPLVLGATDDEFTMVLGPFRRRLALVPAGLALGRLGLAGPARRAYLAANRSQRRHGTAALVGRYVTDRVFRSLVARVAAVRATAAAASTWAYRFSWRSPAIGWACHCLDVPFWFDCLDAAGVPGIAGDAPPQRLADDVHQAAAAFVRTGDPGWPAWRPDRRRTRVFDVPGVVVDDGYASVAALVPPVTARDTATPESRTST